MTDYTERLMWAAVIVVIYVFVFTAGMVHGVWESGL